MILTQQQFESIAQRLLEILRDFDSEIDFDISNHELNLRALLQDPEYEFDSLDAVEFIMGVEDEFAVVIEDDEAESARTLHDFVMLSLKKPAAVPYEPFAHPSSFKDECRTSRSAFINVMLSVREAEAWERLGGEAWLKEQLMKK